MPHDGMLQGIDAKQCEQVLDLHNAARPLVTESNRVQKKIDERFHQRISLWDEYRMEQESQEYYADEYGESGFDAENPNYNVENDGHLMTARKRRCVENYAQLAALDDEHASIDEQIYHLAEQCAAIQCPGFADIVYSRLPRELRDMVYDLLWTRPVVEAMDERISSVDTSRYLAALNSIPTLPVPFFTNPRFVGPAFAHEAAIYYLRAISRAEIPYRCVRNYLQRNTFGPLRFPWLDVIHRLTIALDWEICNGEHVAHADLQDSLARLLDLRDRENLTVTIYLSRDFQYSRALFPTLDVIAPFYHALSESKLTVKILGYQFFAPGETSRGNLVQGDDDTTSEQLNYYFAGSAEDWLAMKAAEIETIARPGLRKKCFSILETMRQNLEDVAAEIRRREPSQIQLLYDCTSDGDAEGDRIGFT